MKKVITASKFKDGRNYDLDELDVYTMATADSPMSRAIRDYSHGTEYDKLFLAAFCTAFNNKFGEYPEDTYLYEVDDVTETGISSTMYVIRHNDGVYDVNWYDEQDLGLVEVPVFEITEVPESQWINWLWFD